MFTDIETSKIQFIDEENLSRYIMDLSLDLETRLKALDIYYKTQGGNDTIEVINKITTIYEMSGTKVLRNYLFSITQKEILEPFLQSLCAKALWDFDKNDILAYQALEKIYPFFQDSIGTPYKVEFLKMLLYNECYIEKGMNWFCDIINNQKLNCNWRYKTVQSLNGEKLKIIANVRFFNEQLNDPFYRILASQYLLQNKKHLSEKECENVETILLNLSNDNLKLNYNLRADCLDVLLQYGSSFFKEKAQKNILSLGVGDKKTYTIYDNAQNVHRKEVEESVMQALEFLQTFEIAKGLNIEKIQKTIEKEITCPIEKEKINASFTRIIMDRALYSRYNCTLCQICLKIWSYILGHKNSEEMQKRFIEELVEMSGTCSSGFASRLVNSISGFDDFNMKLSWEDQISANLTGRLNARIRDMDNLLIRDKILQEMSIESGNYECRKNFLKFFRKNMLSIREEMYSEFKTHISDTDFDLYFRKAISIYETGDI